MKEFNAKREQRNDLILLVVGAFVAAVGCVVSFAYLITPGLLP